MKRLSKLPRVAEKPSPAAALVTLRAASGLFAGAVIPLIMAYLGDNLPCADRQAVLGRFMTGMVMAQMLTGPLSSVIGGHGGWRLVFLVLGVFGIAVGAALAVLGAFPYVGAFLMTNSA